MTEIEFAQVTRSSCCGPYSLPQRPVRSLQLSHDLRTNALEYLPETVLMLHVTADNRRCVEVIDAGLR
jgi:hypothetical protein